jgi:hypothetical protein
LDVLPLTFRRVAFRLDRLLITVSPPSALCAATLSGRQPWIQRGRFAEVTLSYCVLILQESLQESALPQPVSNDAPARSFDPYNTA